MTPVKVTYLVQAKCTEATGSCKGDCVGGTADIELTVVATTQTLLTGSGSLEVTGTLVGLKSPVGKDMLEKVPAPRTMTVKDCRLSAGRLVCNMQFTGVDVELTCYVTEDGSRLTHGNVVATITKFLWRFFIKTVGADFSGTQTAKEISGS